MKNTKLTNGFSQIIILVALIAVGITLTMVLVLKNRSTLTKVSGLNSQGIVAGDSTEPQYSYCDLQPEFKPEINDGSLRYRFMYGEPQYDGRFFNTGTLKITLYAEDGGWKFPEDYDNGLMTIVKDDGSSYKLRNMWRQVGTDIYEWEQFIPVETVGVYIDNGRFDPWVPHCDSPWSLSYENNGLQLLQSISTPNVSLRKQGDTLSSNKKVRRYEWYSDIQERWVFFTNEMKISVESNCARQKGAYGFNVKVPIFRHDIHFQATVPVKLIKTVNYLTPYKIIRMSDKKVMWSGTVMAPRCK